MFTRRVPEKENLQGRSRVEIEKKNLLELHLIVYAEKISKERSLERGGGEASLIQDGLYMETLHRLTGRIPGGRGRSHGDDLAQRIGPSLPLAGVAMIRERSIW